jgi:hypothetical protein
MNCLAFLLALLAQYHSRYHAKVIDPRPGNSRDYLNLPLLRLPFPPLSLTFMVSRTIRCRPDQNKPASTTAGAGQLEPQGYSPPAEAEANYYKQFSGQAIPA